MSKECTDVENVLENTDRKKIIPQVNISKSKRPGSSLKKSKKCINMKTISSEEYIDYKEIVPEVKKPKLENSDSTLEKGEEYIDAFKISPHEFVDCKKIIPEVKTPKLECPDFTLEKIKSEELSGVEMVSTLRTIDCETIIAEAKKPKKIYRSSALKMFPIKILKSTNTKTVLSPKRIDCKKLIAEVAKSPLLYNVDLPQYGDRCLKTRRWLDVTVAVTNNWDELDTHQKDERIKAVRKKWKCLRDSFMRDFYQIVRTGRKAERKSYNYYEDLKFLLSVQTGRFKFTKNSSYITHNIQAIESDNIKSESDASDANPCDPLLDTDTIPEFDSNQESKTDINKNLQLNVANIRKDEDMLFFLSLMPDYKKFTSEQKYRFKMAVMDLMSKEVAMNQLISS